MTRVIDDLLPGAVSGYARRLHAVIGDGHHIASPLGAWLVLALVGAAARGPEAERPGGVLGMPVADAAATLMRLFGPGPWEAAQAVAARYHRRGFEGAAVTALGVALSGRSRSPGRPREAVLRFDHPFAVVATTVSRRMSPWLGLPVFSAWVTEPEDAAER